MRVRLRRVRHAVLSPQAWLHQSLSFVILEATSCTLLLLDKEGVDLWVVVVGLCSSNRLIHNGLQAMYVGLLFLGVFCRKTDIAKTQSEGHEVTSGLLGQAKLVALMVVASMRCARLVGLKVVALTRCVRLVSLRVVALHCGRSRWGYKPSLVTWLHAALLHKIACPLILILKTIRSSFAWAFKADNDKFVGNGTGSDGGVCRSVASKEKLTKSKSRNSKGNNDAMEEVKYLISEAREVFNHLRQVFIKALILQHFDLECYI